MSDKRLVNPRLYIRAVIAITLIVVWVCSAISGLILWLAPEGSRSGQQLLLLNITKESWGEILFWICIAVVFVTLAHIIIDWKALRGVIRYMTSVHRDTITRIE